MDGSQKAGGNFLNLLQKEGGTQKGIAGNDEKFHKSHQILKLTKISINKLCLGKILCYKTVRIKFSVGPGFLNKPYDKKRKHGNAANQHKAF